MALTNFLSGPLLELTISILDPRTLTLLQEIFTHMVEYQTHCL
jgi:hypothetical protein